MRTGRHLSKSKSVNIITAKGSSHALVGLYCLRGELLLFFPPEKIIGSARIFSKSFLHRLGYYAKNFIIDVMLLCRKNNEEYAFHITDMEFIF